MKKQKFKSSEEKKDFLLREAEWNKILTKYKNGNTSPQSKNLPLGGYKLSPPPGREYSQCPSLSTNTGNNAGTLKESPKYTGTEILGISVIHKSCLQPIFSRQEAIDAGSMRR